MPMDASCITNAAPPSGQEPLKPKMSRKSSKPLMEKRRRARINDSLCQLKALILEATNKDTSRHSKLEKADILEMTVKYLRNTQRNQISGNANNNSSSAEFNRYRLGYSECIGEVSRYLDTSESAVQLRTQLIGHLANRCSPPPSPGPQHQQSPAAVAFTPARTPSPTIASAAMVPNSVPVSQQSTATSNLNVTSSGEIRVVLPSEALRGGQLPSHFIPVYAHGAPSLASPTSSTSSMDTAPSPTQQLYSAASYQQQTTQEPTSAASFVEQQQQQTVPISYIVGVAPATTSPLMGSAAPTPVWQAMSVQSPAARIVTFPPTEVPMQTAPSSEIQEHQEAMVQQHHLYVPSSTENAPRIVNINVQHQAAASSDDESVWRPW